MKIETACGHCGKTFAVEPARFKHRRGKHCSPACQYAAIRARQGQKVRRICAACGETFYRYRSWLERRGGGRYCSRKCRDDHWLGDATPNYQGGPSCYRGPHWQKIKRQIRERDSRCVDCGATKGLHVHHITPYRMFNDETQANHPSNLETLCGRCHRTKEAKFKWAKVGPSILQLPAGGYAWELARAKGMI